MTRDVITVRPGLPLKDVARLLIEKRISGVPVVGDGGEVLGIVSEADILRKEEGISPELSRPLAWLVRHMDGELEKIEARTAADAMTSPAITVRPTQQVSEIARLMIDMSINRAPVVSHDDLVGIVSRADLMRAFVRTDAELEHEIREDVLLRMLLLEPGAVEVSVDHGRVSLRGRVNTEDDVAILERCVRRVPGVLDLHTELEWAARDTRLGPARFGL